MVVSFPKDKIFVALDETDPFSIKRILENYGYTFSPNFSSASLLNEFSLLRRKIIANPSFNHDSIAGVIIPYEGIEETIDGKKVGEYLQEKNIPAFLRIDAGLAKEENGTRKFLTLGNNIYLRLSVAKVTHYIGVKVRSLIYSSDNKGIKDAVNEEFKIAKAALMDGLIPIIEIEIDIHIADREKAEKVLLDELLKKSMSLPTDSKVIYRLSFPEKPNLYSPLLNKKTTLTMLASTSGYSKEEVLSKLKENPTLTPAFSRAFIASLKANMDDEEFGAALKNSIIEMRQKKMDLYRLAKD